MNPQLWNTIALLVAISVASSIAVRLLLPRVLAWRGVWFTWHTRFGPALVFDHQDDDGTPVRLLNVGGTFQSVCYTDEDLLWDLVCEYHRTWALAVHAIWPLHRDSHDEDANAVEAPLHRALVMGGGGFSFPKWMVAYRPDFCCETVEIDPKIVEIARDRLFLAELERRFCVGSNGRLRIVVSDAWAHLKNYQETYDLIVNDAFGGRRPMGGMDTQEGVRHLAQHLTASGVYVGNVRTPLEGKHARPLYAMQNALQETFDHVWLVPERPENPLELGNNTLVASNVDLDLSTIEGIRQQTHEKEDGLWPTT